MSTPEIPPELQFPNPHLPSFAEMTGQLWPMPEDPMVPDAAEPMTDFQRAQDYTETQVRETRSEALRLAVYLRDDMHQEGALHIQELDEVVDDARRFYEYIWEGK